MNTFPEHFRDAAIRAATRHGWKLREYEYWGVPILALSWDVDSWVHSLQFDLQEKAIGATRKREQSAGWRQMLRWAYNVIPMFPFFGNVVAANLGPLHLQETSEAYERVIETYAQRDV